MTNLPIRSFGYHASAGAEVTSLNPALKKTELFLSVAQKVAIVALTALCITTFIGLTPHIAIPIVLAGVIAISAFYYTSKFYNYKSICETAGIVLNQNQLQSFKLERNYLNCEAIPTENCADTERWREKLVEAAEHNIVISASYAGGKSFLSLLEKIEKRMEEKPDLKVVILSHTKFLSGPSLKKVKYLEEKFKNFSLVESPDIWHVSPGLKKSTNHTKGMAIDYGKYFLIGGSPIKDNFSQTGLDNLTKKRYLENSDANASDLNGKELSDSSTDNGLLSAFIPGNFRDMDFVFGHANGSDIQSGQQVYKQLLLLSHRWEQYNCYLKTGSYSSEVTVKDLGLLSGKKSNPSSSDSVTLQLLRQTPPPSRNIQTRVQYFDKHAKKVKDVKFKAFASGPEQSGCAFTQELIRQIDKAKQQIVIAHMYFQPHSKLMNSLREAAKRGVKIKVISCGEYEGCPNSHYVFGSRNKYNYARLVNNLSEKERNNVKIFEYQQKKKGFHKKVILVDNYVLAGSGNFGYKSLVSTSDHELNFIARSSLFTKETMRVLQQDIKCSKELKGPIILSSSELFRAYWHRLMAPLIG